MAVETVIVNGKCCNRIKMRVFDMSDSNLHAYIDTYGSPLFRLQTHTSIAIQARTLTHSYINSTPNAIYSVELRELTIAYTYYVHSDFFPFHSRFAYTSCNSTHTLKIFGRISVWHACGWFNRKSEKNESRNNLQKQ